MHRLYPKVHAAAGLREGWRDYAEGFRQSQFARAQIERVYAGLPRWLMALLAMFGDGIMQARQLRGIERRAESISRGLLAPARREDRSRCRGLSVL